MRVMGREPMFDGRTKTIPVSQGSCLSRRAAALMEALLAVTILTVSLGVLGQQFNAGAKMAKRSELQSQAMVLAEMKVAELESFNIDASTDELEGDFGDIFPDFKWRVLVDTTSVEKLYLIVVEIKYDDGYNKLAYRLWTLKAEPARFDIGRDFGIGEDQLESIQEEFPIDGIDLTDFSLADLGELDIGAVMQLLPQLMMLLNSGRFGGAFGPEQIRNMTSAFGGLGISNMDGLMESFGDLGDLGETLREGGRASGGQPDPFGLIEEITGQDVGGGRRK